jgi:hypothetical protein
MKRLILLTAFTLTVVVSVLSGYTLYIYGHPGSQTPGTHGPLQISFVGPPGNAHPTTGTNSYPRALLLSRLPSFHDPGPQSDQMVRVVNTGKSIVTMNGFNATAPWYAIEVDSNGVRSLLPYVYTSALSQPTLKPGASLEFPVIPPDQAQPWRVRLEYQEMARSNAVTRVLDRVLDLLHRPPRAESRSFTAWSDDFHR